jgi:hypothetical protein
MDVVGMTPIEQIEFQTQPMGIVSRSISENNISALTNSDSLATGSVSSGAIPAVKTGLVGSIAKGASNVASGVANGAKDFGNVIAKDVLPKPEPLSTTLFRNKFLSAVLVGGLTNGIRAIVKVAKGEYNQDQALHAVAKDTGMGAIAGLSFASGMGASASIFGDLIGVGGVPLSLIALTVGTLATIGATELAKAYIPFFADIPPQPPAQTTPPPASSVNFSSVSTTAPRS